MPLLKASVIVGVAALVTVMLLTPRGLTLWSQDARAVIGVLVAVVAAWVGAIGYVLEALPTGFQMDDRGFVPARRSWRRLMRRKKVVPYTDVESCVVTVHDEQCEARVALRGGEVIHLNTRDGVSRDELEEVARRVGGGTSNRTAKGAEPVEAVLHLTESLHSFRRRHRRHLGVAAALAVALPLLLLLLLPIAPLYLVGLAGALIGSFALVATALAVADAPFEMSERGFVPSSVPLIYKLKGKYLIEYERVAECRITKERDGFTAAIVLKDGVVLRLRSKDGVPSRAFDQLSARVPTIHVRLRETHQAAD